ncbi:hypothetical protein EG347_11535 [Chryseobacterium sp. G0186]|uniref:hypothetical protein n=1 Tax=Chryseobacterium sp. G0186 TaxID=2487064 RepID=UPI000F4F1C1D|nr:hypothetical protein [Chryseobacterium sp. G0186]AZA78099.1 hypothetical protein EG347_11535 [Chryseobacterium sp. G0186]
MSKKKLLLLLCIFLLSKLYSQGGKVGIDTSTPHQKTVLDIVSKTNNTGVLFPRLTTSNIASVNPTIGDALVDGLWVYNTDTKCYNYWAAAPQNQWLQICGTPLTIISTGAATLNCTGATSTGTLVSGQAASGVSVTVPYTAGNGGPYSAQSIASTGVAGLTANIGAGNFNNGSGNLVFNISGAPTTSGTATFAINMGGSTCSVSVNVNTNQGQATLTCNGTTTSGTLVANTTASGVSFTIPYTAGNGGPYAAQSITPTGVAGLTASIAAGNFNNGSGSLTYTVSGQPTSAGTASFAVNIGGSTCTVNLTVIAGYNLSKLKILSVGLAPWGIDSSVNSGLGVVMENPYIFSSYYPGGSNTAAPFQTIGNWDITRRSVASGGINDLNNSGYKLLLVGYTYDITASEIASVQAFVNNGGTVIWYSEVNSVNTANLVRTYVGQGATMSALGDCYANNTGSSILVGDFGDARLMKYGNDACNPKSWSGVNFNLIEPLSFSPTNQNIVGFKSKTSEFYWFGDGGMTFYSGGVPPVSGNRYPWLLDGGQRPVIGTWNNQTNISNSVMMMNIIVKAMKAAQ